MKAVIIMNNMQSNVLDLCSLYTSTLKYKHIHSSSGGSSGITVPNNYRGWFYERETRNTTLNVWHKDHHQVTFRRDGDFLDTTSEWS
jgi:hypothetical protein